MSMTDGQECDLCDGAGVITGQRLINHGDDNCTLEPFSESCRRCGGLGSLSADIIAAIAEGKAARKARMKAGRTLADEAKLRNITVSAYSAFERGVSS